MSTEIETREQRIAKLAGALKTAFAGDIEFNAAVVKRFNFESGDPWYHFAELVVDLEGLFA